MRPILLLWQAVLCLSASAAFASAPSSPLPDPAPPACDAVWTDTTKPVITCPASVTLNISNGFCAVEHFYTVTATDNEPGVQVTQSTGFPSGSLFPAGQTVNTFTATDAAGNTASCTFRVTAVYPNTMLICKGEAVVNLETNCTLTLLHTQLLEPGLPYGCSTNYLIQVDREPPYGNGPWVPGVLGSNDVNKTFQFRVTDVNTGVRCTGNLKPKDAIGPMLACPEVVVSCALPAYTPAYLRDSLGILEAFPEAPDACGGSVNVAFLDTEQMGTCDSTFARLIKRRWTATDARGNSSVCTQRVVIERIRYGDLDYPADVQVHCDNPQTAPSSTGSPRVAWGNKLFPLSNNTFCAFGVNFQDSLVQLCGGSRRILRTWTVVNWCLGNSVTHTQVITVSDLKSPILTCPAKPVVSTTATNCIGPVNLPDVVISDACSHITKIRAYWTVNGQTDSLTGTLENFPANNPLLLDTMGVLGVDSFFPAGLTAVRYVATDACGNTGSCTTTLEVWDQTPPAAQCDTLPVGVTLGPDGSGTVAALMLDGGSTDLCTPVRFKAKRQKATPCFSSSLYEDEVVLCCDDIGDTVLVTLRVFDVTVPAGGVAANLAPGHFTDCTARVMVGDVLPPRCTAPPDVTVACKDFNPNLTAYGDVETRTCRVHNLTVSIDSSQFNSACKLGELTRYFRTFDVSGMPGASCSQRISVTYEQNYFVRFPDDLIVTTCDNATEWSRPTLFGVDCERMQMTFSDEVFTVVPDACYRIERTWRIVNTCTNNPNQALVVVPNPAPQSVPNHPANLPGPIVSAPNTPDPWKATLGPTLPGAPPFDYSALWSLNVNGYTYKQIIKVVDVVKPVVLSCPTGGISSGDATTNDPLLWNESYWLEQGSNNMREAPIKLNISTRDGCSGSEVTVHYLLFLDLDQNGSQETVISSRNPPPANTVNYNNFNTPNYAGGTPRNFDERNVASTAKYRFALQTTIQNNTRTGRVMWNTQDMPLNYVIPQLPYGKHRIQWEVEDRCTNLSTCEYTFTLGPGPLPQMACDTAFQLSITPQYSAVLTLNDVLPPVLDYVKPDTTVKFGLRKAGSGTGFPLNSTSVHFGCFDIGNHSVEVWARDPQGNTSTCTFEVSVADLEGYCNNPPPKQVGGRVRDEYGSGIGQVAVTLKSPALLTSPTVVTDTSGAFFYNATVPAGSPYELVPQKDIAPLNGVSTFDLVLISKHILGLEPITSPYRLIAADGNRSGSVTTFDIVEFRKLILGIYTRMPNAPSWRFVPKNFVFPDTLNPFKTPFPETIQVGAIYEDSLNQRFVGMKVGDMNRSVTNALTGGSEDRTGTALLLDVQDRMVQAGEVCTAELRAAEVVSGAQFTLEHPGLRLLELQPGPGLSADHFALHEQALTVSCETPKSLSVRLVFEAEQSGRLSEMLHTSDRITRCEAYRESSGEPDGLVRCPVALRWDGHSSTVSRFELYPNQPNPFSESTTIGFFLPAPTAATLTVFDQTGKTLFTQTTSCHAGYQSVLLDDRVLPARGVLYYRLQTATHSAVRKMVRE